MKNQKIYLAKKLIKSIDKDIRIIVERKKYSRGLACLPTEKTVFLGFRATDLENKAFVDLVNELQPNFFQDYPVSLWLMGVLHEVGHIKTHQDALENDYNNNVQMLEQLVELGVITEKQQNEFYVRLDLEQMATQWAIDYIKGIA